MDTLDEINETVTHTVTQTDTANRKAALRRSQGQISNDNNTSKPTVIINKNILQNTDSKLNNKKIEQNKNTSKNQADQKLGGGTSEYVELKRNTKKKVTQEEEESNHQEIVEEFSEEFITVEDSSETSEVKD